MVRIYSHFQKFTDDEVEEYKKVQGKSDEEKRVELWKVLSVILFSSYRKALVVSIIGIVQIAKLVAIDLQLMLTPIVRALQRSEYSIGEEDFAITEMYDFLDKCTETEWKECLRKVDPHELLKRERKWTMTMR